MCRVGMVDMGTSNLGGNDATYEVASGASTSEVQIFPGLNDGGTAQHWLMNSRSGGSENITQMSPRGVLPGVRRIPSGTRITGRQATGSDRVDGLALLGLSGAVHG